MRNDKYFVIYILQDKGLFIAAQMRIYRAIIHVSVVVFLWKMFVYLVYKL